MKSTMLVLSKEVSKDNHKFTVYYGYRQDKNEKGEFVDRQTTTIGNDGKPVTISKSIKVALTEDFLKKHEGKSFPLFVTIDMDKKDKEGKSLAYVTVDKDSNKVVRKDKNGKKHLILVIKEAEEVIEAPRKSYSLDDVDTFEG